MLKSHFRAILATVAAVILCAAVTITGIAVTAASHSNAALPDQTCEQTADFSKPALKDGTWLAEYEDGTKVHFVINTEADSFAIMDPDMGIGVPGRFEYISAIGMYKIYSGSVDNELDWRVVDNSGDTAVVSDENSSLIYLTYLSADTMP